MDRGDIITRIMALMDEFTPYDEGLLASELSKPISAYIDEILNDAATELLRTAPLYLLPQTVANYTISTTDGIATVLFDQETSDVYIRLAFLKFLEWKRPLFMTISMDNPVYVMQLNTYTRGGLTKPVAVEFIDQLTNRVKLDCYTVTSLYNYQEFDGQSPYEVDDIVITEGIVYKCILDNPLYEGECIAPPSVTFWEVYTPAPNIQVITMCEAETLPEKLIEPLCFLAAARTQLIFEAPKKAELFYSKYYEFVKSSIR
jgi:hypothetical protein